MDEQAALESLLSVMMAKMSGGNLIHDVGYMESGLTSSFEMIVLTDELVALADNFIKGIEISDETLMLDEIHQVGPGGHFMDTEATLSRFRDFWYPSLLDRNRRDAWLASGSTTLGERLKERVTKILSEHQAKPLDPEARRQVQAILAKAA
jgi:trimethylamine--corrinoid protein Co-methyltransferase